MTLIKHVQILFLALIILSSVSIAADKAPPLKQQYNADVITSDVYVVHGPLAGPNPENQGFMNNPGIIVTSEGVVIIDPGSSVQTGEMVVAHARKISDKPIVASFSTHIHGDHWLGNQAIHAAFPDAKLYAHPKLTELANNGEAQNWIELMLNITEGATAGTVPVIPDQAVNDGDAITIGNKTFKIIHKGQAHTETDIMIHLVEDDVYFLGDNNPNERMGRLDDGSFVGLVETLDVAIDADARHYIPGHGASGSKEIVVSYRNLIAKIYEGAEEYYEEGLSDFEMKPMIVESLHAWHSWSDFDESIGRFVSLAVLEAESHAFD